MFDYVTCMPMVDIGGKDWQLCVVVFVVRSVSKYDRSQRLLASLNCFERAEFEDDYAVSLAVSSSK